MTRSFLSLKTLVVTAAVALVACGPRLKPVEYEEPKGSGSGASDDSEPTTSSHKSKSSSSGGDVSGGSSGENSSSGKSAPFKPCDEKINTCGAPCTECAPGNQDCMEVLIMKHCNAEHKCVAVPVDCTSANKKDAKKKKAEEQPPDSKH